METLFEILGLVIYTVMAGIALWGAFCVVLVWRRVGQTRFRDEEDLEDFFEDLDEQLDKGDYEAAVEICEDDRRAMPQLALFAIENRELPPARVQRRLVERFQQDVLADIERRLSWVSTVIKSAPMIGLFGTVIGMMAAFSRLGTGTQVDTGKMAQDIMLALITTALGLAIAVPLILLSNGINIRLRGMEDLISLGLTRLSDTLFDNKGR